MGSLGRCLARSLPRGQPGLSPPGPRCYGSAPAALQERTLLVAKPDAVQRRLLGDIIQRFERRGFKLVAMKLLQADRRLVEQHYEQLRLKPFYPALVAYMTSGPVVAMVRGQPGGPAGRGGLSCPCLCPCPCPAGVGGLQRGAVHAGHGWGQQRRGDNPRGPQRAHHQVEPRGRDPRAVALSPSLSPRRNVVHASDSAETAQREIGFWFQRDELVAWDSRDRDNIYGL
ncbi:nucleoside diphosphate kinase, mitochondrial-like isoform X1 [Pyrgilauda ruficollis]|uniref:nucleoside diphosphate kinase, mitochondrial-like isoform X1 n=1 Tax=Pyrgilauda ruficollis TaxID=221976 RepID=UPI001B87FDD0|nr:nucleoside diphosphate kinase, mitochondrial-like isoform X1 [Pyrgilauda ruficollis]